MKKEVAEVAIVFATTLAVEIAKRYFKCAEKNSVDVKKAAQVLQSRRKYGK